MAFDGAGLKAGTIDHVLANPPFFRPGKHRAAPDADRARARMLGDDGLLPWIRRAASLLRSGGSMNLVLPTDLLPDAIAACAGRFGAIDVMPLHPRAGMAADRVLLKAVKESRAAMRIVPGLVMHDADGSYSAAAARVLREGQAMEWPAR